jgi:hypothetical protein
MSKNRPLLGSIDRCVRIAQPLCTEPSLLWECDAQADQQWSRWRTYAALVPHPLLLDRIVVRQTSHHHDLPIARLRRAIKQYLVPMLFAADSHARARRVALRTHLTYLDPDIWTMFGAPLRLKPWLDQLLALAACSFESSLGLCLRNWSRIVSIIHRLQRGLDTLGSLPVDFAAPDTGCLMKVVFIRITVVQLFATWVLPQSVLPNEDDALGYAATLYTDTHLDLISECVRAKRWDDDFLLANSGARLTRYYPMPHRVCCVEELPNLSNLLVTADLYIDPDRQKKATTLKQAITHLFVCKMMNQICHIRHLVQTAVAYIGIYPVVRELFRLVLRVSLLGNIPLAQHRLPLDARVRINLAFGSGPDAVSDGEIIRWMSRSHNRILMFLMREHFLYTFETESVLDTLASRSVKWVDFKRIVRIANARTRDCIAAQVRNKFNADISWDELQISKARAVRIGVSAGDFRMGRYNRIVECHVLSLTAMEKILKGRIEFIVTKKMIPVRSDLVLLHTADAIDADPVLGRQLALIQTARTVADLPIELATILTRAAPSLTLLDAFYLMVWRERVLPPVLEILRDAEQRIRVAAWAAAHETLDMTASVRQQRVLPLRWLKLLPLTDAERERIKRWVFGYYVYDLPDDQYRMHSYELGRTSLVAYFVVFYYFRFVAEFRTAQTAPFILLSAETACRQLGILRDHYAQLPFEATLPELGLGLYCERCEKWATPLQESPIWITHAYDHADIEAHNHALELGTGRRQLLAEEIRRPWRLHDHRFRIDPLDGERYCVGRDKMHRQPQDDAGGGDAGAGKKARGGDNPLVSLALTPIWDIFEVTKKADCDSAPLSAVDLVGVWFHDAQHRLVGLCNYCAAMTEVKDQKITNGGLSCMNHPHEDFPADHPQTIAFAQRYEDTTVAYRHGADADPLHDLFQRQLARHPHVLDHIIPCAFCGERKRYKTRAVIRVFDNAFRLYEVPLCKVELGVLRLQLPTLKLGQRNALGIEPIWLETLVDELDRAFGQQMRQRKRRREQRRPALPNNDALAMRLPLGEFRERIRGHRNFAGLQADGRMDAALGYDLECRLPEHEHGVEGWRIRKSLLALSRLLIEWKPPKKKKVVETTGSTTDILEHSH